ncbi:MAG: hypothetical protein U5K32_07260 [Bacteroidales bacterium]|nr:hypothetical protein [Bacteroidales bacterium]
MENNNNHDKYFRELLSDGSREMPFNDFEDELMAGIHREQAKSKSVLRNIRLSWIFFFLGLLSGIALVLAPQSLTVLSGLSLSGSIMPVAVIASCLIIIFFLEKLIGISFARK